MIFFQRKSGLMTGGYRPLSSLDACEQGLAFASNIYKYTYIDLSDSSCEHVTLKSIMKETPSIFIVHDSLFDWSCQFMMQEVV